MSILIFDSDTQSMVSDPNAAYIENTINILQYAKDSNILIAGSLFYDEDVQMPKLKDTIVSNEAELYIVPVNRYGMDIRVAEDCTQVYFEKGNTDIWSVDTGQPDNLNTYLRYNNITEVYIVGGNHFNSISYTIAGFIKSNIQVFVVVDAISNSDTVLLDFEDCDSVSFINYEDIL